MIPMFDALMERMLIGRLIKRRAVYCEAIGILKEEYIKFKFNGCEGFKKWCYQFVVMLEMGQPECDIVWTLEAVPV